MVTITPQIEPIIVNTKVLFGDHNIDLLLVNQLLQLLHAIMVLFVLDDHI